MTNLPMKNYDSSRDQPFPGMPEDPHPECRAEWHGADGGACPACGGDSYPIPAESDDRQQGRAGV